MSIQTQEKFAEKHLQIKDLPQAELDAIHNYARISTIGASTRIENAILTDSEVDLLDHILGQDGKKTAFEANRKKIQNKFSKDHERSLEEVAGCRTMLYLIYEQSLDEDTLTESKIRGLHQELMRYDSRAGLLKGAYKNHPNKVVEKNHETSQERIVFETADPGIITTTAMSDLINWYNQAKTEVPWPVSVASEFVFRFLAIHPFQDGNGRLGRALFLLSLLQSQKSSFSKLARYLAIDRQIERHKEEYYLVLNHCSDGKFSLDPSVYKIQYFNRFMLKILDESLKDIDHYRKKYLAHSELSQPALKILECFKDSPELRFQTNDLCQATGIPRRTVVFSLNRLLDTGFIQKKGKGPSTRYQLIF